MSQDPPGWYMVTVWIRRVRRSLVEKENLGRVRQVFAEFFEITSNFVRGPEWRRKMELSSDPLDRNHHATNIAKELSSNFSSQRTESYIFAISGHWGEGKTDLLKRIRPKLLAQEIPVVWFNPWQYTEDAETLRRTFLKVLSSKMQHYRNIFQRGWFWVCHPSFLDSLKYSESKTAFNRAVFIRLFGVLIFVTLSSLAYQRISSGHIDINNLPGFLITEPVFTAIIALFSVTGAAPLLLDLIRVQRSSSKVSSVDEFEELFNRVLSGFDKVVVLIDDLDRCTPEGVKIFLDSLKTFFGNPKVNYVITGDHAILERYLGKELDVAPIYMKDSPNQIDREKTRLAKESEGKRFLKKLFNVYWRLPIPDQIYMSRLVHEFMSTIPSINQEDRNTIEAFLLNFLEKNLREIERFVETLTFSLKAISSHLAILDESQQDSKLKSNLEEVQSNPVLLAKVLLIQEKFDPEFKYLAEQPSRYATLEREQITNSAGEESANAQNKLGEQTLSFFGLVKTKPQFHNERLSLEHTPDVFFYYSGFAGASEKGVLNEDFLRRYVAADEYLMADLRGTDEGRIRQMLPSGISYLNQLGDATQLSQAINNLLAIFQSDVPTVRGFLGDFLDSQKVKEYYNSLPDDDSKNNFILSISLVAISSGDQGLLNKILSEDPWSSKKEVMWNAMDTSNASGEQFKLLVDDILNDERVSVEVAPRRQKILDSHFAVLVNPSSRDNDKITESIDRLNDLSGKLGLNRLANEALFGQVVEVVKNGQERKKRELLLGFLQKGNSFWEGVPRPTNPLELLNPHSRLRRSEVGAKVLEVYESWYPRRQRSRRRAY